MPAPTKKRRPFWKRVIETGNQTESRSQPRHHPGGGDRRHPGNHAPGPRLCRCRQGRAWHSARQRDQERACRISRISASNGLIEWSHGRFEGSAEFTGSTGPMIKARVGRADILADIFMHDAEFRHEGRCDPPAGFGSANISAARAQLSSSGNSAKQVAPRARHAAEQRARQRRQRCRAPRRSPAAGAQRRRFQIVIGGIQKAQQVGACRGSGRAAISSPRRCGSCSAANTSLVGTATPGLTSSSGRCGSESTGVTNFAPPLHASTAAEPGRPECPNPAPAAISHKPRVVQIKLP